MNETKNSVTGTDIIVLDIEIFSFLGPQLTAGGFFAHGRRAGDQWAEKLPAL
jgi:hypothetical protein